MRIAVVGSGIAGNAAAWALARTHGAEAITVYEQDGRIGGHSATVDIDYDGTALAVDTGFIVYNTLNYPDLTALFAYLGVETSASDMSFAVSFDKGAFEWAGKQGSLARVANGLLAQRSNALSPRYLGMLREVMRFNKIAMEDRKAGRLSAMSLGDYIRQKGFSAFFRDRYIVPMGSAIWSTPAREMLDFTAENFIAFFENHRLLHWERPVWRTVTGGSRRYVAKLIAPFKERIRLATPVTAITRDPGGVTLNDARGGSERYDHVVIAAHSDQALAMLSEASGMEQQVLSAIPYRMNQVYLHRDERLMPRRKRAWAAWNLLSDSTEATEDVVVTYWMNALQGIAAGKPVFVTLNPVTPPAAHLTFGRFEYAHPQYNASSFAAQKALGSIQGKQRTWFCGAWTGYGFHEDGLRSGLDVAEALGAAVPWRRSAQSLARAAE